jgi:tetratricopeptide (TPR) repeat protein
VAALSGLPLDDAQDALDDLVDVHLVDEPEPGAYRLHDLLREFAAALAAEVEPVARREALRGVLDLQLHAALATMLPTYRSVAAADLRFPEPLRPDLLAALTEPEARLERERRGLAAFLEAAEAEGLTEYAWKIPRAAWRFLWVRSYFDDVAALQQRALRAAERLGDDSAVATTANYLASVYYRRSEIDEARALLERSIRLREALGERGGLATAMGNLAGMHHVAGHWARAIETAIAAQRVAGGRRSGHESSARLNVLALGNQRLGRFAEALRYHRLRLLVLVEVGDLSLLADALVNLAVLKYRLGLVPAAVARRHLELAVRVAQRANSPFVEAEGHNELARLLSAERRFAEAVPVHRRAITMASRHHDLSQQATFRLAFGSTLRAAGNVPAARTAYEEALRLGRQARMPYLVANAQAGLGDCLAAADPAGARRLWEQARETFAALDAPERAGVERRLARRDRDQLHSASGGGTMVG